MILGASSDLGTELIRELDEQEARRSGERAKCMGKAEKAVDADDQESAPVMRPLILAHYGQNREAVVNMQEICRHVEIEPIQADLSIQQEVCAMLADMGKRGLVPTHIVSMAAAKCSYMRISEWDAKRVKRDMDIQFFSLAEVFRVCLPEMAKRGYGKVVVMLSAYTVAEPPKYLANYTSVKYALLGLVRSAAAEYGDQGLNINGISPEMIETKFLSGIGRKVREINAESSPRHRNLTVKDVIPSVLYLLSEEAEFVNGVNLNLTGRGA
ncbi:MAG: SDR family oxidoreductase [bacterium]|nr:SDR family oxidoreductase [bacterium]